MMVEMSSSERAFRIVVLPELSRPRTRIRASLSSLFKVLSKLRRPIFNFLNKFDIIIKSSRNINKIIQKAPLIIY